MFKKTLQDFYILLVMVLSSFTLLGYLPLDISNRELFLSRQNVSGDWFAAESTRFGFSINLPKKLSTEFYETLRFTKFPREGAYVNKIIFDRVVEIKVEVFDKRNVPTESKILLELTRGIKKGKQYELGCQIITGLKQANTIAKSQYLLEEDCSEGATTATYVVTWFENEDYFYVLTGTLDLKFREGRKSYSFEGGLDKIDQIYSTFKFLDDDRVEAKTPDYVEINNEELGFRFKAPGILADIAELSPNTKADDGFWEFYSGEDLTFYHIRVIEKDNTYYNTQYSYNKDVLKKVLNLPRYEYFEKGCATYFGVRSLNQDSIANYKQEIKNFGNCENHGPVVYRVFENDKYLFVLEDKILGYENIDSDKIAETFEIY